MGLTPNQLYSGKVTPKIPYSEAESKAFLHAVKCGELETVKELTSENKYLVYVHDECHLTALHWASK